MQKKADGKRREENKVNDGRSSQLTADIYIQFYSLHLQFTFSKNQATVAFSKTPRISSLPFPSASNNPSKTRDFCGFKNPLAIWVSLLSPVIPDVGTSPLTVRWLLTTGMLRLVTMSLIAVSKEVETPPAPAPATYSC